MKRITRKYSLALCAGVIVAVMLLASTTCLAGDDYTWVRQNPLPEGQYPASVSAADATHVWAVGAGGAILFYDGDTLTRQSSGTTYNLFGVHALDVNNVWAVGDAGTILHTSNGGSTWVKEGIGKTSYDIEAVWATEQLEAGKPYVWAVCDADGFTDATILSYDGNSWEVQYTYASGGLVDISGYDANNVWAVDCETHYYNGTSWGEEPVNPGGGANNDPYVVSACGPVDGVSYNLWSISWWGQVLKSKDGGYNWEDAGLFDYWPVNISALNNNNVWVSGWDGKASSYNGTSWTEETSGTTDDLYDVCALDATHIYSVGSDNFLFYDYEAYGWGEQDSTTTSDLNGVSALSQDSVWAVGANGTVVYTANGGSVWGEQTTPTTDPLYDVDAVAADSVWAGGGVPDSGIVLEYDGADWVNKNFVGGNGEVYGVGAASDILVWVVATTTAYPGDIFHWSRSKWVDDGWTDDILYDVSAATTSIAYAAGAGGTICYTPNGRDWYIAGAIGTTEDLYGVSALDGTHVWAVGNNGTIMFHDGSTWSEQTSPTSECLYGVSALDADNVWAVGAGGTILHTTDGGSNWTEQTSGTTVTLRGVSAADSTHVWAVGDGGTILGCVVDPSFSGCTGGTTENLNGVSAISQDSVWAVGENSTIQYTSTGGETWVSQSCPTTPNLLDVDTVSADEAWAVGWNPSLSRGEALRYFGGSWSLRATLSGYSVYCVAAAASDCVWIVDEDGWIYKWNGSDWVTQLNITYPLYDIVALDTSHVWAVGATGMIRYTANGGTNWGTQASGTAQNLYGVSALSTTSAWAVGANGTILRYDGSWSVHPQSGVITTQHLYGVSAADENHVWAVGANGTVLFFDGAAWSVQDSGTAVALNAVSAFDANNIWAVGNGGTILFADPPYIKYCYPTWGNPGQTLTVEVVGAYTHFDGSSVVDFGEGTTVVPGSLQILDYTILRVQITIDPDAARGPRDISVVTGPEEAIPLAGGFMVCPDPAITGTDASYGLPGWTGDVLIEGNETHFDLSGQASFGEGIAVNYIKDIQPDKATANITISPDASLGERDVNLVSGGETPRALAGGFTVVNTPEGTGVKVNPDSTTTVEFDRVTSAGITTSDEKPDPTTGGYPVVGGTCRDVSTTATYSGNVRVTLSYPDSGLSPEEESRLVILHEESGNWVDRTKSRDTRANRLTAEVGGLSRFVVVLPGEEPSELSRWYLAEGTTAWGFNTYITLMNPNDEDVTADITYMTPDGPVIRDPLVLPALSQTSVAPANDLPFETDFSTRVICKEGKAIAVDRTMWWTGQGAPSPDGHCSIGVNAPAETWYLPEGCSAYGFETWLLIQNPNDTEATAQVTYMTGEDATGAAGSKTFEKKIPANSRCSYNMADDIGQRNASIKVDSDLPVIPERAMYRNDRREGHDSIGATTPADDYYLAEGTTAHGFDTYLLVQNPGDTQAQVTVTYMTGEGPVPQEPFTMPPGSRGTVRVNDVLPDTDFSTRVSADKPIVAERAMYWGADTPLGEASQDTIGMAGPHTRFYLPDGKTADGHETYTLVGNPGDTDVTVGVTYLTPAGEDNVTFTATVPAGSRATFNMADEIPDGQAAILVTSKTEGQKIMVERAMYWNQRGAGTCTIGGYTD